MATPYKIRKFINKIYGSRFFWSKMTRHRVVGWIVERIFFKNDDVIFLPKDSVISINETVNPPESMPVPSEVVDHFIRQASFVWIMDFCICRDSAGCKDYPVEYGCIFLGEAAGGINPRFGRRATADEAIEHARRCRQAGLVHMIGRNRIDTIWLNLGPPGKLMTICNCCPCCCLWQTLPHMHPDISRKMFRMPGIHMLVGEGCTGCGICLKDPCFVDAIHMVEGRALIDQSQCRGCGRCASACPQKAISVVIENPAFIENAIRQISKSVDVT
jgi:ferredoxin